MEPPGCMPKAARMVSGGTRLLPAQMDFGNAEAGIGHQPVRGMATL